MHNFINDFEKFFLITSTTVNFIFIEKFSLDLESSYSQQYNAA